MKQCSLWQILLVLVLGLSSFALELPSFFTDNMVLQRDSEVRIWGKAAPGSQIVVSFAGQSSQATANADGKWLAKLQPMTASAQGRELQVTGDGTTKTFSDVLVGDIWLCAGQSNMQWALRNTNNVADIIAASGKDTIRLLSIPLVWSRDPKDDVKGSWVAANPETSARFSSVGYLVGQQLASETSVPMGLIMIAWGGCRVESMSRLDSFDRFPSLKQVGEAVRNGVADMKAKKDEELRKDKQRLPTALYNAMVHPLGPMAVKGMLWYQGEDNHYEGAIYGEKLKALALSWRECFQNPTLPIYIVQIPPWQYGNEDPTKIPNFWLAQQTFAESDPNAYFIVTTDCGQADDIHPRTKIPLARRLANQVLFKSYGIGDDSAMPPTFKSAEVKDDKVIVSFNLPNGLKSRDGNPITFLTLAGADGIYHEATGFAQNDQLIVSSPEVKTPAMIRFGWHKLAMPNLVNRAGHPVAPFEQKL